MSWLPILALAALAFLAAALLLRLPRSAYALTGAALLFGLAGYALQGSPATPAAPGAERSEAPRIGALLVEARREFHDPAILPSRLLVTSDAFARRGDYVRAADFARGAVIENPADSEAWTALGNALTEHAGGRLTPAAIQAFREAERRAPASPAPGYFLGLALLRAGEVVEARAVWAGILARAPTNAPWRPILAERLARLDALIGAGR
ncbi:MAG: hypothetical protein JNJ92_06765 [Altererythrobacter sp.]|nr:hypothetical protein [Altererythrobacter sp.]